MNTSSLTHYLPTLFGVLMMSLCATAQQPLSNAPVLSKPPKCGAWEVTYKFPLNPTPLSQKATTQLPPNIQSREYTVNGELGKCEEHYSDGKTVTSYIIGKVGVSENPQDPKDLMIDNLAAPYMASKEFRKGYPGIDWVRPDLYKGMVKFHGAACHYFAEGEAPENLQFPVNPSPRPNQGRQAWFDMNGRPVAYKTQNITAIFTHKPANTVPAIEVPESIRAVVKDYLDSLNPKTRLQ